MRPSPNVENLPKHIRTNVVDEAAGVKRDRAEAVAAEGRV
jgi:hypothetical protein